MYEIEDNTLQPASASEVKEDVPAETTNLTGLQVSDVLSEDETRFFVSLVQKWFLITNDEDKPVETFADLESGLKPKKGERGARYQLWALQMQCKFGKIYDPAMLRKKWENMMRSFKKLYDKGCLTASTEGKTAFRVKFKFLDDMSKFFTVPLVGESRPSVPSSSQPSQGTRRLRGEQEVEPDKVESVDSVEEAIPIAENGTVESLETEGPPPPKRSRSSKKSAMSDEETQYLIRLVTTMLKTGVKDINDLEKAEIDAEKLSKLMEKRFGGKFPTEKMSKTWNDLLNSYKIPSKRKKFKFSKEIEALFTVDEEELLVSDEAESDGELNENLGVSGKKLLEAFHKEAEEDRKLMRKMMKIFSKAFDVSIDSDSD